jgi:hypothetical protein
MKEQKYFILNNFNEHCFKREYINILCSLIKDFHKFEIDDVNIKNKIKIILSAVSVLIYSVINFFNQKET